MNLKLSCSQTARPDKLRARFAGAQNGDTALHIACLKEQTSAVHFLLTARADPDTSNKFGNRPLHYAAESGCMDAAILLVDAGAPVGSCNNVRLGPASLLVRGSQLSLQKKR